MPPKAISPFPIGFLFWFFRKPQRNQKKRKIIRILVQNNRKYGHQSLTNSQSPFKRNWPINLEKKTFYLENAKVYHFRNPNFPHPHYCPKSCFGGLPPR
jgi:hypothetical protein